MNDGIWCELIVCTLHRYGSCVNPLGIARGQSHSNVMLSFSWKRCWLVFSYHGEFSRFQESKYIEYSAYTGCISLYIYCLKTCNIKSLFNVPKISHISRKISQVSRFPAKSPDSRNKFVFLPKQPLLELPPPVVCSPPNYIGRRENRSTSEQMGQGFSKELHIYVRSCSCKHLAYILSGTLWSFGGDHAVPEGRVTETAWRPEIFIQVVVQF